ncbi:hypothetical protein [Caloranaerobacter sp. DY30410]|uniref:hypothetical protein n=1 Tax=Caloranaerobacter sp. DY30410 TaxID=3238305 RepID=UPI003D06DFCC
MNEDKVSKIPRSLITPTIQDPVKRYVFEDGSVLLVEIFGGNAKKKQVNKIHDMFANDMFIPENISGSGYTIIEDQRVSIKRGLVAIGFTIDYCYVNGGYDYIIDVRKPYCNVVGGTYSDLNLSIVRKRETASLPAEAVASANVSFIGGIAAGGTHFCVFKLQNDKYEVTYY